MYWSYGEHAFIADVPELRGRMAHRESQDETLASAQEAIQLWIDTAREFNAPLPEPKGRRLKYA